MSMTKQEFISKQRTMEQNGNKRMMGWLLLFFGVLLGGIPFSHYIEAHPEKTWIGPLFGMGAFLFLLANLALLTWFTKHQQKRFGVSCPKCGKPIIGFNVKIAIATGNCGNCGEPVFTEANPGSE
jgi:hypothetical protein